jgi:hypothetical protein
MTSTTWLTVTSLVQDAGMLVGFIAFILNPKTGRKEFFLLGLILLISLATDLAGMIGWFIYKTSMNLMYNTFYLLVLPMFLLFYKTKIKSNQIGGVLDGTIILFLAFGLINLFFIQDPFGITSYTAAFVSISMIVISIVFFYRLIKELPTETITKLPMFWINTAVLIYYSGIFFQYLAADYLVNVLKDDLINSWTLKNFLGIFYYLMLAFALWLNRSNLLQNTSPAST